MLSSTISRQRRDRARRVVVEAVAGVALEAERRGLRRRDPQPAEFVVAALVLAVRARASHQAPVCSSTTGAPQRGARRRAPRSRAR